MQQGDPDPDRHLKRLQKVFGVSERIQQLALRRHTSPKKITKEEQERELLGKSKELRKRRLGVLTASHRFVLEMVGEHFGLEADGVEEGVVDDDHYVRLLDEFVCKDGRMAIMFFYDEFTHPSVGTSHSAKTLRSVVVHTVHVAQRPVGMCPRSAGRKCGASSARTAPICSRAANAWPPTSWPTKRTWIRATFRTYARIGDRYRNNGGTKPIPVAIRRTATAPS